ncbi:hypothetical protein [Vibrio mediterranei]|uniref:hypothetical protein n=2 Tax=Vibrio mediterranei TaxID=689 RepID=UPI004067E513
MTIKLKQQHWKWEQSLANPDSDLAKVAKVFVEHCDRYLSVKELHRLTLAQSDLQSVRYRLVRQHGFQFKMNPDALYEYKLMHINLSLKNTAIGGASKKTEQFVFPDIAPLWRLALGLNTEGFGAQTENRKIL